MYNCNKCFENNWSFNEVDSFIEATCKFCGNVVTFPVKPKKTHNYKICRKCNGKLIVKVPKITAKKLKRKYFYSQFYRCQQCQTIYYFPKDIVYHRNNLSHN